MTLDQRQIVINWLGDTATDEQLIQFIIDAKERRILRTDQGLGLPALLEANDIILVPEIASSGWKFCRRKVPSPAPAS